MSEHGSNPFEILGIDESSGVAEIFAARRRLAKTIHPDRGGDLVAMQKINEAVAEAVRRIDAGRNEPKIGSPAPTSTSTEQPAERRRSDRRIVVEDHPSFTIDALPVVAHAALVIVASTIGAVLVDEPPYLLEVMIDDGESWCRLEIVPDAGSSSVGLTVAAIAPDLEAVRNRWIDRLNGLDWSAAGLE